MDGRIGLDAVFIRTPNKHIIAAVHNMLTEAGWKGVTIGHLLNAAWGEFGSELCISVGKDVNSTFGLGHSGANFYTSWSGWTEMTVAELAKQLAEPRHTMMTEGELNERYCEGDGLEGALLLSIEKWERILEPENWDALHAKLRNYETDIVSEKTCGLCKRFGGSVDCAGCPLGTCAKGSDFYKACVAGRVGNRNDFRVYASELISKMRKALDDLEKKVTLKRCGSDDVNLFSIHIGGEWRCNVDIDGDSLILSDAHVTPVVKEGGLLTTIHFKKKKKKKGVK